MQSPNSNLCDLLRTLASFIQAMYPQNEVVLASVGVLTVELTIIGHNSPVIWTRAAIDEWEAHESDRHHDADLF